MNKSITKLHVKMNRKRIIPVFIMLCLYIPGISQDFAANLEEARRAYYNGRFEEVNKLLVEYIGDDLPHSEKQEAFELLVKTNLMLSNENKADEYMGLLLSHDPLYAVGSSELLAFRELYDSYFIKTRFNFGFAAGINVPQFSVLKYQSLASKTIEPQKYLVTPGFSAFLFSEYALTNNIFAGTGLVYQSHRFSQSEILLDYQELTSTETLQYLSTPLFGRIQLNFGRFKPFITAGINLHYLISAKADLSLIPLSSEFPKPFLGSPSSVEGYDLSGQRKLFTFNYMGGIGARLSLGLHALQVSAEFEYGYHNLVKEEMRYADRELIDNYSYVTDDFKMDHWRFTIGYVGQ